MALHADLAARVGDLDVEVAIEVRPGRCLAVAGPSGAGKTTLLRMLAGLGPRPRRGVVECGNELWLDTGRGIDVAPERRRCGFVFQDYALFGHLSAAGNVAYALADLPRRERNRRAEELLDRFGLADRARAHPRQMSGGERQRVALARALARRPRALVLDEPLAALDARTRTAALRLLVAVIAEAGVPAVVVTHDFGQAALLGDEVGVMDRGRIVQQATPSELAAAPRSAFVADFTGAVVLIGSAAPGPAGLTVIRLDGGGEIVTPQPASGRVAASIFPWDVAIEPAGPEPHGSPRNRLSAQVVSVTRLGGRVRLGLAAGQPLAAEVTSESVAALGLRPGARVMASWKAAATRVVAL